MVRYHISKSGKPALCSARPGECPLTSVDNHFDSVKDARSSIENKLLTEYSVLLSQPSKENEIVFEPGQGVKDYQQLLDLVKDSKNDTEKKPDLQYENVEDHYDLANYYYLVGNVFNDYDNLDNEVKNIVDKHRVLIDNNLNRLENKVYRGIVTDQFNSVDELNDYAEKIANDLNNDDNGKVMSFSRNPYVGYAFSQGHRKIMTDSSLASVRYPSKQNSGVLIELNDANVYHLSYEYEDDENDEFALEKEVLSTNGKIEVYNIIPSDKNKYGVPIIQLTRKS